MVEPREDWLERLRGYALVAAGRLVPAHLRERWLEEWSAELWLASRRHGRVWALRQLGGAWRDALASRSLPSAKRLRASRAPGGLDMFRSDLRHAARALARRPGFCAIAVLTLGLGLGTTTAVFTAVRKVLLEALPFRDAERLVLLFERRPHQNRLQNPVSLPDFADWRAAGSPAFEDMAAWQATGAALTGRDQPLSLDGAAVSDSFFAVLGAEPLLGRAFSADEARPGGGGVVILSHETWTSSFGADRGVLGSVLHLDGVPQTVVGVMPPRITYPFDVDYWVPLTADPQEFGRGAHFLGVIARLADGVEIEEAFTELDTITKGLESRYPENNTMHYGNVVALREASLGGSSRVLWLLFGAVALVLVIVFSNLAGMQLARAVGRRRELAVRASLGANRLVLARVLLAENLWLALAGALVGIGVGYGLLRLMASRLAEYAPWVSGVGLDGSSILFALGTSLGFSLAFGAIPGVAGSALVRSELLREARSSASRASGRLRAVLVVGEIALAVLLLVGTALTARSLQRLLAVDPGFRPEGVLAAEIALPAFRYEGKQQYIEFFDRLEERLAASPGIESVGYTWLLPFSGNESGRNFEIEGRTPPATGDSWNAGARVADADYFRTLGIPLLEGRLFEPADREGAPLVAVVGETMARQFWAGDAIGARFRLDDDEPWITIVGIVGDVRHTGLDVDPYPEFYVHRTQIAADFGAVVMRSADPDAGAAVEAVRSALGELDPELPLATVATMADRIDRTVGRRRAITTVVGVFGTAALLLAAVGIYGVISYTVAQRTREIGVRMALGSGAHGVLRLFLRDGMSLVLLGAALGIAGALSLGRFVRAQLFGVEARDLWSFVAAVLVLLLVALVAVLLPARRAARLDPVETLRAE